MVDFGLYRSDDSRDPGDYEPLEKTFFSLEGGVSKQPATPTVN